MSDRMAMEAGIAMAYIGMIKDVVVKSAVSNEYKLELIKDYIERYENHDEYKNINEIIEALKERKER